MEKRIIPVILCGGSGVRLWPLSREDYPKQFNVLFGENSMLQDTAMRVGGANATSFSKPILITNEKFRFTVSQQLEDINICPDKIVLEPSSKNTAPAILAATLLAFNNDKDAILAVLPSDHMISDEQAFCQTILSGLEACNEGKIVTFGIKPNRAETGYGYLEVDFKKKQPVYNIKKFIEKPNLAVAQKMSQSESYLWNAGIFLFRAVDMIKAFSDHCPGILTQVKQSIVNGEKDLDFFRLNSDAWDACDNVSVDYAIMEKVKNLCVVPYVGKWSDLGDWKAVWTEMETNDEGLASSENTYAIDCKNSLLRGESSDQQVIGIGLQDTVVVAMRDAVLVAHKSKTQEVKQAVEILKLNKVPQAEKFPRDNRPWGWFESLALGGRFQVKRIHVSPGAALSLQSHHHRSEHWIVVEGTAKVTINEEVRVLSEGESIYVPLGATHRLENPGKLPVVLIEVQTGAYLGEDDIIRYEDIYERN